MERRVIQRSCPQHGEEWAEQLISDLSATATMGVTFVPEPGVSLSIVRTVALYRISNLKHRLRQVAAAGIAPMDPRFCSTLLLFLFTRLTGYRRDRLAAQPLLVTLEERLITVGKQPSRVSWTDSRYR